MPQKIISTAENKIKQKKDIFYSSSTVFFGVLDRGKNIDTKISFLNHFLLKRQIESVALRLSVRDLEGILLKEKIFNITKPITYSYKLSDLLPKNIASGEFSIFLEFTANKNLGVPFCAVSMAILSPNTIDHVHTYGRALEVNEINSDIDFSKSYETGWTIASGDNISNFAILHNGRMFSEVGINLKLFIKGEEFFKDQIRFFKLKPFATLKLDLEKILYSSSDGIEALSRIKFSKYGEIDAKINLTGLKGTFPRMLFVALANLGNDKEVNIFNFKYINFTHSNFDFDNASQPSSRKNFGFINNPSYPEGIKDSGFRYFPCIDLNQVDFNNKKLACLPFSLDPLSSMKVLSKNKIPSRIVGENWVEWKSSPIKGSCSTGTFIIENTDFNSYWHWGLLNPDPQKYKSIISIINPFSTKRDCFNFDLNLYGERGLIILTN